MRKVLQSAAAVVALLLVSGIDVPAQTIDLTGGNADQIWRGSQSNGLAGIWMDQGAISPSDGRRDLIIGAPGNATTVGKVYMIFGGPRRSGELSLNNADAIITGAAAGDLFGFATAAGNILNVEDSIPRNLVVAAPGALSGRGKVYLFAGGFPEFTSLTAADAVYEIIGNPGDQLGTALATADLNNDGHREIIIGAAGTDRIYIINGGASLAGVRDLTAHPADLTVGGLGLGEVLAAGDVTGDGIYDLLVGSADLNVVYLYRGQATGGLPTTPSAGFPGAKAGDRVGASVRLGDLDADGIRDVIIGAPGADGPADSRPEAGAVYVLWGSPGLTSRNLAFADVTFHGGQPGHQVGAHVTSGDINRDIENDLVVLAPGNSGGPGELEIYYGRSRSQMGTGLPDGRRVVDFATAENLDRRILGDAGVGAIHAAQVFEVTGEGARDIVASVPAADGGRGTVYFTISPRLRLSSFTLNFILNEGNNTASTSFSVGNPSAIPITWATGDNRSWIALNPATGSASSTSSGTAMAHVSSAGLPPGTHTGTITVRSTSEHLTMELPVAVNLRVTGTRIVIDGPAPGGTAVQPFNITGWALERTSTTNTGVDAVHVYAYPNPGSGQPPIFLGAATYGSARGDVAAAFGPQFQNSGYAISVRGLAPGPYQLVAFAHHAALNTFTTHTSVDVTVRNQPIIAIDTPANNSTVTSAFEVGGWAADLAAATGTGIDAIHVYIYPNPGSGTPPVFIGAASYGWVRNDVGAVVGPQFNNSGYHFTVTGLGPGTYDLGVFARSTVSGQFDRVQLHRITINANALMGIDLPRAESLVNRSFSVAGWAIDRAASTGTGVDTVHVWAYPNPGSGQSPVFLGVASYGAARPDLGSMFGSRFTNCGFNLNVTGLTPGVYDIVIFARSTATNSFNNWAVVRATVQ